MSIPSLVIELPPPSNTLWLSILPAITALAGIIIGNLLSLIIESRKQKHASKKKAKWLNENIIKLLEYVTNFHFSLRQNSIKMRFLIEKPQLYGKEIEEFKDPIFYLRKIRELLKLSLNKDIKTMDHYKKIEDRYFDYNQECSKAYSAREQIKNNFHDPLPNSKFLMDQIITVNADINSITNELEDLIITAIKFE